MPVYQIKRADGVVQGYHMSRAHLLENYQRTTPLRPMVRGRRRRTWEKKRKDVYEYARYYTKQFKKGKTPEVIGYEIRIQVKVPEGADPLDYIPEEGLFDSMRGAFPELKGRMLRTPVEGIRRIGRFTDERVVAAMGPGWDMFSYRVWRRGKWVDVGL